MSNAMGGMIWEDSSTFYFLTIHFILLTQKVLLI